MFNVLYLDPIDCSDESICHLAWLQNYEVGVKFWLKCSNGTWFKDLQPGGFNQCQMEHSGNAVSNTDDISPIENSAFDYSPCTGPGLPCPGLPAQKRNSPKIQP